MNADCRHSDNVNAFVADELSPREHADFETHLSACAECRAAVESTQRVTDRLRALPQVENTRDLSPLIRARLHEMPRTFSHWPRIAAIAAAVALFAGGALVVHFKKADKPAANTADENAAHVARALDWFCHIQEPDGSWNAEKWGGHKNFEVALTALPTLALLSAELPSAQRALAVANATRWLQKQHDESGSFGPEFQGTPYNQSIATLALLRAYQRRPGVELKHTLNAAIASLLARQAADGGWGYLFSPFGDSSITEWHIEALELAIDLGWENTRPNLNHARIWLATHPDPRTDAEEPVDSPSALLARNDTDSTALDFYRAYFLTITLKRDHNESTYQRLAAIRHKLLLRQTSGGNAAGSWPADDRWGRAGGRLYSTALASLALGDRGEPGGY